MTGVEVALAALAIVSTVVGALVWVLRELFKQNQSVIGKLSVSLDHLTDTLQKSDADRLGFERNVLNRLVSIDQKADRNYQATIRVKEQTVMHQTVLQQEEVK